MSSRKHFSLNLLQLVSIEVQEIKILIPFREDRYAKVGNPFLTMLRNFRIIDVLCGNGDGIALSFAQAVTEV